MFIVLREFLYAYVFQILPQFRYPFCPGWTEIELRETQMTYIIGSEISAFSEKQESS